MSCTWEVIKHKLLRDFNLDVKVHKPRVNYRETIANAVTVTGECNRQWESEQLFARLTISVEPSDHDGSGALVISRCSPEEVPGELLMAAIDELQSRGDGGGLIGGFPLSKLKVTVLGGEAQLMNSNEVAFRIAAGDAFDKALRKGEPVLLEPIMKLDISTPEAYMGDIVGDVQQRRGIIAQTEPRGMDTVIEAHAPLSELFGYSSAIRSLSQGRAGCSMQPLHFAPAPPEIRKAFGA